MRFRKNYAPSMRAQGVPPHKRFNRKRFLKYGGNQLRADHRRQQKPRWPNGPERAAGSRDKNRQMPRHRQLQIHQRSDELAVQVKHALTEIKQPERRDYPGHPQHCGNPQHDMHVPGFRCI